MIFKRLQNAGVFLLISFLFAAFSRKRQIQIRLLLLARLTSVTNHDKVTPCKRLTDSAFL